MLVAGPRYRVSDRATGAVRDAGGRKGHIPEELLARLWQKRAVRQAWLRTGEGARVRVIYPGRASNTAGPDFRDALLELEGVGLVQGDVEIHLHQRDWEAHGHQGDPNYNGVVLHAALDGDAGATTLQSGQQVPIVFLEPLLNQGPGPGAPAPGLWGVLARQGYSRPGTSDELALLLDRAGDARFLERSDGLRCILREQDPEQTLYEGLLEALGYRANRHPFLKLAARAPYALLQREGRQVPYGERSGVIESWLAWVAGLAAWESPGAARPAGFGPPLSPREWRCFRVRPANHPRRRITAAALLLHRYLDDGLLAGLEGAVRSPKPRGLAVALAVAAQRPGQQAYIGVGRARDMAVNAVLPLFHALATERKEAERKEAELADHCLSLYQRFSRLQDNELTQEMAEQLTEPTWRKVINNARRQQGLLYLESLLGGAR